ncbi:hypothetical protein Gasu2_56020 [Galdieria sulphuraria]|nr:hypothetical protein Gasu2_56020 [Galdieria sulphuraria]
MSLLDLRTAFFNSSYVTQPIGNKSHEILCKLENIQRKKLEDIRNAPAPLPLGVKSETCSVMNDHSNPTTITEFATNQGQLGSNRQGASLDDDAMIEEEEETLASPISSWIGQ